MSIGKTGKKKDMKPASKTASAPEVVIASETNSGDDREEDAEAQISEGSDSEVEAEGETALAEVAPVTEKQHPKPATSAKKPKRLLTLQPPRSLEVTMFDRLERMYGRRIKRMLTVQYRYIPFHLSLITLLKAFSIQYARDYLPISLQNFIFLKVDIPYFR